MMKLWRSFFAIAAIFNLGVAAMMLAAPARFAVHLGVAGTGAPYIVAMAGLLIGAFGVGYAIVANDITRNRGVVWIGLIGKVGVVMLAALQFAAEIIPFRYLALGMGDMVFATLFAVFLWRTRL